MSLDTDSSPRNAAFVLLFLLLPTVPGCAPGPSGPSERPPFEWFFVGANFRDVPAAAAELEDKLGLDPIEVWEDWAMLSSHWLDPNWPTWEIERRSDGPAARSALSQPIRLHVFGETSAPSELEGPEGLRLTLVPSRDGERGCPAITRVDLQAWNTDAMEKFYTEVLGLMGARDERGIVLRSHSRALLVLVSATQPRRPPPAELADVQLYLGFQTPDLGTALRWVEERGAPILQEPKFRNWGGTDLVVTDPDGNPVWIVQDHVPHRLRRFHHGRIFGGEDRECLGRNHVPG